MKLNILITVGLCAFMSDAAVNPALEGDVAHVEGSKDVEGRTFVETFEDWGRSIMDWFGFEDDEYDYDYYNTLDNNIGFSDSTYTHYEPARDDYYEDEDESSWSDTIMNMMMTAVPLGLMAYAMPAGVFTLALRRSLDESPLTNEVALDVADLPLLYAIESNDILDILPELTTRQCQEKLFCELSKLGNHESGSAMQRAFYYLSTLTPKFVARRLGVGRLFDVSKKGECKTLTCNVIPKGRIDVIGDLSNNLQLPKDKEN